MVRPLLQTVDNAAHSRVDVRRREIESAMKGVFQSIEGAGEFSPAGVDIPLGSLNFRLLQVTHCALLSGARLISLSSSISSETWARVPDEISCSLRLITALSRLMLSRVLGSEKWSNFIRFMAEYAIPPPIAKKRKLTMRAL